MSAAGPSGWHERMDDIGLEHVEVSETPGHPVVYGDWLHAPGAPTVIVYAHYDVQPVDPLEEWVRPPFEPRVEGGRVYARGVADDKGQVLLHLWAAQAWLATVGRLPLNVRYVFEGEEEAGSPNFRAWLLANRARLDADLVVVTDTGFFEGNHPAVTVGLRGNVYLQVDVRGPSQDLHSGSFGGLVQNPAVALVRILASLHDDTGRVSVPGFYDDVRDLTPAEHAALAALPFDEEAFAASIGVPRLFGEPGHIPVVQRGARPTLDICGLWSGFQGEGTKTIIPAHAHAKLSARLVPDQDPPLVYEQIRDAILAVDVPGVEVVGDPLRHDATLRRERRAPGRAGRRPLSHRRVRGRPVLHPRGRLDRRGRQLRRGRRQARRPPRVHQPRRPRALAQRVARAGQPRGRHAHRGALLGGPRGIGPRGWPRAGTAALEPA